MHARQNVMRASSNGQTHAICRGAWYQLQVCLADSWFTCESLVRADPRAMRWFVHYIGLAKMNPKLRYQTSKLNIPKTSMN